ncbi:MAG: dienelactone hydrolase family protein [Hyphomicrobiales bacterium]|nr:dienelactone hydrolase family protein [Hyphomicrobiales bacterium]
MAFRAGTTAGFAHVHEAGDDGRAIVLLHGGGRDERDLLGFGRAIAPGATLIAPRGRVAHEAGWILCPRRSDRSFDPEELVRRADEIGSFVSEMSAWHALRASPILVGHSDGAAVAAAMLCRNPGAYAGAVLLRPASPGPQRGLPALDGRSVLMLAGARDQRREAAEAPHLAQQLSEAGATVDLHVLDADHGFAADEADATLARDWIAAPSQAAWRSAPATSRARARKPRTDDCNRSV